MIVEAWMVEVLDCGFITGFTRFAENSEKISQIVSNSFLISAAMCFRSAWKGEAVNVV